MSYRTAADLIRRLVMVATLGSLTLTGCAAGTGAPSAAGGTGPGTSVDATVVQGTSVPAGWPTGLDLPVGAALLYSTVDADGMSILFDAPPDLAALSVFFDTSVTALGFRPESNSGFVDMLSRSWTDGTTVVTVTATPVDGRISGVLMVRPAG